MKFPHCVGSCETSSDQIKEKDSVFDNYEECIEKCIESEDEDLIPYNVTSNHYKCYPLLDQEIGHSVANSQCGNSKIFLPFQIFCEITFGHHVSWTAGFFKISSNHFQIELATLNRNM